MPYAITMWKMAVQVVFSGEYLAEQYAGPAPHCILSSLDTVTTCQIIATSQVFCMEPCTTLCTCAILNCVLGSVGAVAVGHMFVPTIVSIEFSATLRTYDVLFGHLLA